MTFQSKIGTSLPPEREHVRVSLALLSSPPSALSPASAWYQLPRAFAPVPLLSFGFALPFY